MPVRLLSWAPEYGTALQATDDDAHPDTGTRGDHTVEVGPGAWCARRPDPSARPAVVQIIDGVRRTEAHALQEGADGLPLHGVFGAVATGAVRCRPGGGASGAGPGGAAGGGAAGGGAHVLEETITVRRFYLQQLAADAHDIEVEPGVVYAASLHDAPGPAQLVALLTAKMRAEEARLAEELAPQAAADADVLTVLDGPIALPHPPRALVGLVKRIHTWYLDDAHRALLATLAPGERTPLFHVAHAGLGRDRFSWFLRLAELPGFHPYAGLVRLEAPGELPLAEAVQLADRSAVALPPLASSPHRDPRAPQNLVPVGALEARLAHRLGSGLRARRRLAARLGAPWEQTA